MQEEFEHNVNCIRDVLSYKRIEIRDIQVVEGPVISLYKIYIVPGVKIYKVKELADDFAMAMGVTSVRTVTLRDSIGVEVPDSNREYIPLKEMMESKEFLESLLIAFIFETCSETGHLDRTQSAADVAVGGLLLQRHLGTGHRSSRAIGQVTTDAAGGYTETVGLHEAVFRPYIAIHAPGEYPVFVVTSRKCCHIVIAVGRCGAGSRVDICPAVVSRAA